jgi:hypothetical protein
MGVQFCESCDLYVPFLHIYNALFCYQELKLGRGTLVMISLSCHFLKHGSDLAVEYELNYLADHSSVINGIWSLCISHVDFKTLERAIIVDLFEESVQSQRTSVSHDMSIFMTFMFF